MFLPSQSSKNRYKNSNVPLFEPQNPDYLQQVKDKMQLNHFMQHLGFRPTLIEPGCVEGSLEIIGPHTQHLGFLHGGVIATLADLAAGWAAFTLIKKEQSLVTAEMKVSFLNPGDGQEAIAKGYVVKPGRMLYFAEAEIWIRKDSELKLIAKSSATYAVVERP